MNIMGHNKKTMVNGLKMIFRKNWGVYIDSHEIDSKLTFGENFNELHKKKVKGDLHDIDI